MSSPGNILSATLPNSPVVGKDGRLDFTWLKWFQGLQGAQTIVNNSFAPSGAVVAPLSTTSSIEGRGGTLGSILANLGDTGLFDSTDNIGDGTGSPLAGGEAAYAALIASAPATGDVLKFNGALWLPAALAAAVDSIDGITGAVTLVAGSGITIADNTPVAGSITVTATAGGGPIRGTVTVAASGTSGTFKGSAAIAGAATTMACCATAPGLIALCGTSPVSWVADVASAGNVEVQVTLPNVGPTWGNITFQIALFT